MQWLERIAQVDGRLAPIYVDPTGCRTAGSLRYGKTNFQRRGYHVAAEEQLALDSMTIADTPEYLEAIGIKNADPSGHRVYALQGSGRRILVPALVLLSGMLGRLSAVGDRLLEAASLDGVAKPIITSNGELQVRFHLKARLTQDANLHGVQSRFAWLTCFPSARRFWGSVYGCAAQGHLGLTPPSASVDATFAGHRTSDTVFATRMAVRRLAPTERSFPFAKRFVPDSFEFYQSSVINAQKLNAFRASGQANPCIRTQSDLVKGPAGWKMTDEEWAQVLDQMKQVGFMSPRSVKASIDIALEKFGGGKPWTSMGPSWRSAEASYQNWLHRGEWALLKRLLAEIRSST